MLLCMMWNPSRTSLYAHYSSAQCLSDSSPAAGGAHGCCPRCVNFPLLAVIQSHYFFYLPPPPPSPSPTPSSEVLLTVAGGFIFTCGDIARLELFCGRCFTLPMCLLNLVLALAGAQFFFWIMHLKGKKGRKRHKVSRNDATLATCGLWVMYDPCQGAWFSPGLLHHLLIKLR